MSDVTLSDPRRRLLQMSAVLLVLGVTVLWVLVSWALGSRTGQRLDDRARLAVDLPDRGLAVVFTVLGLVSVGTIAIALVGYLGLALARRRLVTGVVAVILVTSANVATQVLKYRLLDRPDFGLGQTNTLPSGHTTVMASLALAALLVLPRAGRVLQVAAAAALATFVGAGTVLNGWHRPSDVLAGLAVCAACAGAALLVPVYWSRLGLGDLAVLDAGWPRRARDVPPDRGGPARAPALGLTRSMAAALAGAAAVGAGLILLGGLRSGGPKADLLLGAVGLGAIGVLSAVVVALVAASGDLVHLVATTGAHPQPIRPTSDRSGRPGDLPSSATADGSAGDAEGTVAVPIQVDDLAHRTPGGRAVPATRPPERDDAGRLNGHR